MTPFRHRLLILISMALLGSAVVLARLTFGGLPDTQSRSAVDYLEKPADALIGSPAPDFSLRDHRGGTYRLSERRGRPVVLYFGYTHCPNVCPATASHFQQVWNVLGPDADEVDFAFITVDPKRDKPERLKAFLESFDSAFIGLWGPQDALEKAWRDYGVHASPVKDPAYPGGYRMRHSWVVSVIDREGYLRLLDTPVGRAPDQTAAVLKRLLREGDR